MQPLQQAQHFVEQHQAWAWLTTLGTAALAWIAPIAGVVTIGLGCLQGYVMWQKYKAWKEDRANGRSERSAK